MYTASIIIGLGAAVIWTAQGDFLGMQSPTDKLMMRNTGIFWVLFQCSLVIGNLYIYLAWSGKDNVGRSEINLLFTGLSVLAGIGTIVFLLLKAPFCGSSDGSNEESGDELLKKDTKPNEQKENESSITIIINGIKNSFSLLLTMDMILIAPLFLYSGFSLSFFSGIYTTAVGNTKLLEGAASMLGLVGVGIGLGQVVGGGIFVFGSNIINKVSRTILLNICLFIHFGAFVCIYLNIPKTANQDETSDPPAVLETPNKNLALFTAFLLGLGDAGVNNVIYTTITFIWKDDTVSAFGLMKCLQSSASAISFAIASIMNLYGNMLLLVAFSISTIITYIILRRRNVEVPRSNDDE
jgi:MFS family permease